MIELRPFLDPSVREAAEYRLRKQGLRNEDLAAAVTAEQIREALSGHRLEQEAPEPIAYADAQLSAQTTDEDMHVLLLIASHFTAPKAAAASASAGAPR
jgi:hypothetical protein